MKELFLLQSFSELPFPDTCEKEPLPGAAPFAGKDTVGL